MFDVEQYITKENDDALYTFFQNRKTIYTIFLAIFTEVMFCDCLSFLYMELWLMDMFCLLHEMKDLSLSIFHNEKLAHHILIKFNT